MDWTSHIFSVTFAPCGLPLRLRRARRLHLRRAHAGGRSSESHIGESVAGAPTDNGGEWRVRAIFPGTAPCSPTTLPVGATSPGALVCSRKPFCPYRARVSQYCRSGLASPFPFGVPWSCQNFSQSRKSRVSSPPRRALGDVACSRPPHPLPVSPGTQSGAVPSVRDPFLPGSIIAFGPGGHRQIHGGTGFGAVRCNLTARHLPKMGHFGHPRVGHVILATFRQLW